MPNRASKQMSDKDWVKAAGFRCHTNGRRYWAVWQGKEVLSLYGRDKSFDDLYAELRASYQKKPKLRRP